MNGVSKKPLLETSSLSGKKSIFISYINSQYTLTSPSVVPYHLHFIP